MDFVRRAFTSSPKKLSTSGSRHGGGALLQSEEIVLHELGLHEDSALHLLRDSIFERFSDLIDQGMYCNIESFLKDCIHRGIQPDWADAAFRAFESPPFSGQLSKFNYCLAIVSLLTQENELVKKEKWLELRRRVVFSYYDTYNAGNIDFKAFEMCLNEISNSTLPLQSFGIIASSESLAERDSNFGHTSSSTATEMGQSLALTKVHLAEKSAELMDLQLLYLQLEKKFCALKLELAEERARKN